MKSNRSNGPADATKANTSAMLQLRSFLPELVLSTPPVEMLSNFKQLLQKGLEKAQKQHIDSYDPVAAVAKVASLEQEANRLQAGISPLYATIVMRYSSYQHVNRDRLFFEGLYITIINICDDALNALGRRSDIELFLGGLFRGRHFNLYRRINAPPRSIDTLSLKEVYAIKHETQNRALNSKLLSSLNSRPQMLNISAAAVNNSPLISSFISSVITARALIKDPEFRKSKMNTKSSTQKMNITTVQQLGPGQRTARPAKLCIGNDASVLDVSATPTAYPPASSQGKLPSNGLQTETTTATLDTSTAADIAQASTLDSPIGDISNKLFVGPGFENLGFLYDETMADLEDLREYCISGRHPKLEMRKSSRRTMTRAESSLSMKRSSVSATEE